VHEGEAISILLVEDDPTDTRLLLQLLDHADVCRYSVRAVATAAEAEVALRAERPDVVLLDLSLPDCDGVASVDRILSAAPGMPVVVLTGRDDYALGLRSIEAGAQDFLVKGEAKGNAILRCAQWALARVRSAPSAGAADDGWSAADRAAAPLAVIDHDLTVRRTNAAFAAVAGRPAGDLAARPLTDLIHDDDVIELVLELRSTLHGETPTCRRAVRLRGAPAPILLDLIRIEPDGDEPPQLLLVALPG
jgi:CheY-like chemotaxis protein